MSALTRRIDGAGQLRLAVVLGVYFAILAVLRLSLFPGGSDDDAEILYYTQSWAMAYKGNQPPLYAWLVMAAQSVSGPTMGGVIAVKYALLAAFYAFSYLAARRLFSDNLFAAFAPLSLVACFFIGWDAVINYSHTVLLLTAMSATLWLLLRLEKTSDWVDYLWLALAIAAGLLSKYNFVLFLIPLLFGAWRHPGLRPRVFCLRFGGALVLALAIAGLPVVMFLTDREAVAGAVGAGRLFPVVEDRLMASAKGLGQFMIATLGLVSPFLPLGILFFPRSLTPLPHPSERLINAGRFLEAYLLSLLILSVAAILATGATDVRNNWLVVWFPLPFYMLLRIKVFTDADGKPMARRLHWFAVALLVIAVAVPAGLAGRGIAGLRLAESAISSFPMRTWREASSAQDLQPERSLPRIGPINLPATCGGFSRMPARSARGGVIMNRRLATMRGGRENACLFGPAAATKAGMSNPWRSSCGGRHCRKRQG